MATSKKKIKEGVVYLTSTKENKHVKEGSIIKTNGRIAKVLLDKGFAKKGGKEE